MRVKELREKYGFSQQELANLTGIPKGRINGWEQKGTKPKAEDFTILTAFFRSCESKDSQGKMSENLTLVSKLSEQKDDLLIESLKNNVKLLEEKAARLEADLSNCRSLLQTEKQKK